MIYKFTIKIFLIATLFAGQLATGFAQKCSKKKFCDKEWYSDYDFRSQSSAAILAPGDTARASIVVYSRNDVRIMICTEEHLGDVQFKIFHPTRKVRKVIDEVNKTEEEFPVFKKDENGSPVQEIDEWDGEPMVDEYGDPVYVVEKYDKVTNYDTTWRQEEYVHEELLFDSQEASADRKYYDEVVLKTKRLIVEVVVPDAPSANSDHSEGCVNLKVGRRPSVTKKGFRKDY